MSDWTYIYLLPAFVCIFWPVITFFHKEKANKAQVLMCLTMILLTVAIMSYMVWFRGRQNALYVYDIIFMLSSGFCPPLYFMFVCALTKPKGITRRNRAVFLPVTIYLFAILVLSTILGGDQYQYYCIETRLYGVPLFDDANWAKNALIIVSHYGYPIFLAIESIAIIVISVFKIRQFHIRFNNYYADKMGRPKLSLRPIVALSILAFPLASGLMFVSYQDPDAYKYQSIVIASAVAVVEFMVGRYNFHLTYTAEQLAQEQREEFIRTEIAAGREITNI